MKAIWILLAGCAGERVLAPTPELVRAVDVNPDPNVVEVVLVADEGAVEYVDGTATPVIGYRDGSVDGSVVSVPGPLIEAKRGDRLIVHFRNELADRATTVHWHGVRLPIEMDGDPMVTGEVMPGGTYEYDFVVGDAGWFWYHPHVMPDEQIELGMQGGLLVHDVDEPALTERLWMLDDVELDRAHEVVLDMSHDDMMFGRRGDTVLVNGRPPGFVESVPGSVERWRLVNTSNGRFYKLAGTTMRVIAWDGGLIEAPYDVDELLVAPGERYDVLVKIEGDISLHTVEVQRDENAVDEGDIELVRVRATGERVEQPMPELGRTITPLVGNGQTRRFVLTMTHGAAGMVFYINGQRWPVNTQMQVKLGDTETWEIVNDDDHDHPFHIHGHFAQVIDRDGVAEARLGWKDTIVIAPHQTLHAVLSYGAPGKWMAHCQIPEHAEGGMTADVNVTP